MLNKKLLFSLLLLDIIFVIVLILSNIFYISRHYLLIRTIEGSNIVDIYKGHDIEQKLNGNTSNINSILVKLNNPNLSNQDPFSLIVKDTNGNTLRTVHISGRNIGSQWINFKFSPIHGNKKLIFLLVSQTSNKSNSIQAFENSKYQIAYRAYAQESVYKTSKILITQFLNRFLSNSSFAYIYIIILTTLVLSLLLSFTKVKLF